MEFPLTYKFIGTINRSLVKLNFPMFNRNPLVILRNVINRLFFKYCSIEKEALVRLDGHIFLSVSLSDQACASFIFRTAYSPLETKFIVKNVDQCNTFIDVGASYGYFSIIAAKSGYKKILTFEPNPLLVYHINKSIEVNEINNINLYRIALSNNRGKVNFVFNKYETSSGSVRSISDDKDEFIVNLDCLDSYMDNIFPPVLLKIDVEGHEQEVLEGCGEIIKRYKPLIMWESKHGKITEILNYLNQYNYGIYTIEGNKIDICDIRTILKQDMIVSI